DRGGGDEQIIGDDSPSVDSMGAQVRQSRDVVRDEVIIPMRIVQVTPDGHFPRRVALACIYFIGVHRLPFVMLLSRPLKLKSPPTLMFSKVVPMLTTSPPETDVGASAKARTASAASDD